MFLLLRMPHPKNAAHITGPAAAQACPFRKLRGKAGAETGGND
jgi:hypothetical protein